MASISVLMSVYNGEAYLVQALESLLYQSQPPLEIIVVDDGSRDRSPTLLANFVRQHAHIHLITQANRGLAAALNVAWDHASGGYLARLDADDVCHPQRLARQAALLDARPEIGLCATGVALVEHPRRVARPPTHPSSIRCELLFAPPFHHSSVMLRREAFADRRYNPGCRTAQDFEFWTRCDDIAMSATPAGLLYYRVHADQITQTHREQQLQTMRRVHQRQLARLGLTPTADELALHMAITRRVMDADTLPMATLWLERIWQANQDRGLYEREALWEVLTRRFYDLVKGHVAARPDLITWYKRQIFALGWSKRLKLWGRFALRH